MSSTLDPGVTSSAVPFDQILGADFETASTAVLRFLHDRLGFHLWMVTRTNAEDWIVLTAEDHGYEVSAGDLFRWSDSFCSRMVLDQGPRVAPSSSLVPAYVEAPIGRQVPIEAYIGVPIPAPEGGLFGTLCAIDPEQQPAEIVAEQPLIELLAGLLGNILSNQLAKEEEQRRAERAQDESERDALTGLWNRRGWERVIDAEEARARRYGGTPAIVMIDLDGLKHTNDTLGHSAGDELICRAAGALTSAKRESDFVARLGGDEFAMIAVHDVPAGLGGLPERLGHALDQADVAASIGCARRHPVHGLRAAVQEADRLMYEAKRARRAS
jgi:diguanylate cyclase (GGDEF)-like protein